ncbi:DUF2264 domain-containing protein [Magnetospirillum molischianum]|uniref:DUF2264 domain-containing protein n=1 Tax=Magnetospirillum molischianum TaxID=1083 RepID=UPI001F432458|nr:DUF2264 domain-containing protein [Magnetospirillum molischianum]
MAWGVIGILMATAATGLLLSARWGTNNYWLLEARFSNNDNDSILRQHFLAEDSSDAARYQDLFLYFVSGFIAGLDDTGARVRHPGAPSIAGREMDSVEGFTRTAPMLAAWIASGRPAEVRIADGRSINLLDTLRRGLLAGTDPSNPGYWGAIGNADQRTCEAADVARTLWLLRDRLWPTLNDNERNQIAGWLNQTNGKTVADNNWHLFPVIVSLVLKDLGQPYDAEGSLWHWHQFLRFHRGGGWYVDGERGHIDYYAAWGIFYDLDWIDRIDPAFAADAARFFAPFIADWSYVIGPNGIPIMGRSQCYRLAAPVPLIAAARHALIPAGQSRRALDATWRYFVANGALERGSVTQGYCHEDLRLLDNYSGSSSCLWSLRSLIVAFLYPPDSPFWTEPAQPLPIEQSDYTHTIPPAGWVLHGEHANGRIVLEQIGRPDIAHPLIDQSLHQRLSEWIWDYPRRPDNDAFKYENLFYSSTVPLCTPPS